MSSRHTWSDDVAPYLLGALGPDEIARFEAHLGTCTLCQAEVDELRPVVEALPQSVEEVEPPASLKRAVMAEVEREAAGARRVARRAPSRPPLWRRPLPALALACVLLIVGVGVGVVATSEDARTFDGACPSGCRASLELEGSDGTLHVAGMPEAPVGRVYQVWLLREGASEPEPTDALFNTSSHGGTATVDVPGELDDVVRVMVSEEPRGGSEAPTTAPGIDVQLTPS